jgi:hypothetical protein
MFAESAIPESILWAARANTASLLSVHKYDGESDKDRYGSSEHETFIATQLTKVMSSQKVVALIKDERTRTSASEIAPVAKFEEFIHKIAAVRDVGSNLARLQAIREAESFAAALGLFVCNDPTYATTRRCSP